MFSLPVGIPMRFLEKSKFMARKEERPQAVADLGRKEDVL